MFGSLRRNFVIFWLKRFDLFLRGIKPVLGFWKDKISFFYTTKGPRLLGSSAMKGLMTLTKVKRSKVKVMFHIANYVFLTLFKGFSVCFKAFKGWPWPFQYILRLLEHVFYITKGKTSQLFKNNWHFNSIHNFFLKICTFYISGIVCGTMFVISLCFATTTGSYVFAMFDSFSANIPLLIIAFIECVAMSYVYGLKR